MTTMSKKQMISELTEICEDQETVISSYEEVMRNQRVTIDDLYADQDAYEFRIKQMQESIARQADRIHDLIRERDEDRVDHNAEMANVEGELRLARDLISSWVAEDANNDLRDEAVAELLEGLKEMSDRQKVIGQFTLAEALALFTIVRNGLHELSVIDGGS